MKKEEQRSLERDAKTVKQQSNIKFALTTLHIFFFIKHPKILRRNNSSITFHLSLGPYLKEKVNVPSFINE